MHANNRGQPFVDLLRSHPPRALLVAHRQCFQGVDRQLSSWDGARSLLALRRRDVAARLGVSGAQRTVRLPHPPAPFPHTDAVENYQRRLRPVLRPEAPRDFPPPVPETEAITAIRC